MVRAVVEFLFLLFIYTVENDIIILKMFDFF